MIGVWPVLFLGYKIIRRTSFHVSEEIDLFRNLDEIEEYQRTFVPTPPEYVSSPLVRPPFCVSFWSFAPIQIHIYPFLSRGNSHLLPEDVSSN